MKRFYPMAHMPFVRVYPNGQLYLSKDLVRLMGLRHGDRFEIYYDDERIRLEKSDIGEASVYDGGSGYFMYVGNLWTEQPMDLRDFCSPKVGKKKRLAVSYNRENGIIEFGKDSAYDVRVVRTNDVGGSETPGPEPTE